MNTPEISQQDRINAAAAYMLLGWIFLLAKNNPIYQHPYVVQHSKKASKLLLTQALILCIAGFGIAPRINYSIPFISEISYGNVLLFFTFSWAMFHTLHSAFRAYDGKEVGTDEIAQKNTTEQLQDFHGNGLLIISAALPWIGSFIFRETPHPIIQSVSRFSSLFGCIGLCAGVLGGMNLFFVSGIIYVVVIVWYIVEGYSQGYFGEKLFLRWSFGQDELLAGISSLPFLFFSFISVLRERRKIIDIPFWYRKCLATEQAETQKFGALPLAHWWFGVPVFGSICIFFLKEKYREYRNIIIQHLFAQIIFVISLYYFENSPIILLALLPFLWLAMGVKENIHTRIPIVGHAALGILAGCMFLKNISQSARKKSNEAHEVQYKI